MAGAAEAARPLPRAGPQEAHLDGRGAGGQHRELARDSDVVRLGAQGRDLAVRFLLRLVLLGRPLLARAVAQAVKELAARLLHLLEAAPRLVHLALATLARLCLSRLEASERCLREHLAARLALPEEDGGEHLALAQRVDELEDVYAQEDGDALCAEQLLRAAERREDGA